MTRKRANKQKKSEPEKTPKSVTIELAPDMPKITLTNLSNKELESIQNMANINATYAGLLKQQSQYDAAIAMLKIRRGQVLIGELKLPMMVKVTERLSYAESNKDKVLKMIDDDIRNIQLARDGLQGTIEYRRDAFKESLLRTISILQQKVKNEKIEKITGFSREVTGEIVEQEKEALEKEFDKELEKEEQEESKNKNEVKKNGS